MLAWLMDAYRSKNSIVLWLKTPEQDMRKEYAHECTLFVPDSPFVRTLLERHQLAYTPVVKKDCLFREQLVLKLTVGPFEFTRFIRWFERATAHRMQIYNADMTPELQFLYARRLHPFSLVDSDALQIVEKEPLVSLTIANIQINPRSRCDARLPLSEIIMNNTQYVCDSAGDSTGDIAAEEQLLRSFANAFTTLDPDVLVIEQGFLRLPYLVSRMTLYNISCPFHRWDEEPIAYRGGKSFFTYGQIRYRDYAIRLHGRFLIDTYSILGSFAVDGLIELCQLSGARLQQVASRSSGAVFQMALLRDIFQEGLLIPYKQLPLDVPMSMTELVKADRAGHTLDPKTGFHRNVAEIDFMSMYPWLMYNRNISAEQVCSSAPPFEYAPGLPIRISMARKGFVARAIKPFLDRRMYYKHHPSIINKAKAEALKTVLVSANGYLRFREFKLGFARSHMALCAYARDTLLSTKQLAEEQGYAVVHGIIDSLYIKRDDITEDGVRAFCDETEMITGIPVSFEGIFRWVVFLTSVSDDHRPVPARYYGVYRNGSIKARGIEVRQRGSPVVVRQFQQECLELMSACDAPSEIVRLAPELGKHLRDVLERIPSMDPTWLVCKLRISKQEYEHDLPQRQVLEQLGKRGINVQPGQLVQFIYTTRGATDLTMFKGDVAIHRYEDLLVRSLFVLLQPFGFTRDAIREFAKREQQMRLR